MDINFSENTIAVFTAIATALVAFAYKFFRLLKNDKNSDAIDSDEQALRLSLREECKQLRDNNFELMRDKIELLERAVKAEAQIEYLKIKCAECAHKLRDENDQT